MSNGTRRSRVGCTPTCGAVGCWGCRCSAFVNAPAPRNTGTWACPLTRTKACGLREIGEIGETGETGETGEIGEIGETGKIGEIGLGEDTGA